MPLPPHETLPQSDPLLRLPLQRTLIPHSFHTCRQTTGAKPSFAKSVHDPEPFANSFQLYDVVRDTGNRP